MKKLIIIGAGGWGREVYSTIKNSSDVISRKMVVKGFLDDRPDVFDGLQGEFPPILGPVETYEIQPDDVFFVAQGDSVWRKHYAQIIEENGGHFYTFISEFSSINDTAQIGEGSYISRWCSISDNVRIGRHVLVHPFSIVGHDACVKDYGSLFSYVFIGGGAQVGECSQMSPKSMVIPCKKIGNNVVVGAGSVVMKNVPDGQNVFGNPAVKIDI